MTAPTFDTLAACDRLEAAGVHTFDTRRSDGQPDQMHGRRQAMTNTVFWWRVMPVTIMVGILIGGLSRF
ncbi:hypothetical protein IGS68_19135 [Skermanella sp. TT6]|uniref:Uncharacterized protein n=1 Tax=Skermanella cutis TaxID=2775420 RepID=A0ABX7B2V5_9PROT|nr:hypothetical protein [Skermanella sp. TT6]QQP88159.1 hypothetical protein IGS68_19135 [Skermanella sp. TT6]